MIRFLEKEEDNDVNAYDVIPKSNPNGTHNITVDSAEQSSSSEDLQSAGNHDYDNQLSASSGFLPLSILDAFSQEALNTDAKTDMHLYIRITEQSFM
ncbi:unnamed protein product [Gongylonema pulchrum]|uniref:Uncharacterized protein n=1 Tax=Gongylonema pulchrum TaxID=637853 RepID=A0A183EV25_9BILA|nr:unnamed protein product [Gongylonema pulchrum]